MHAVIGLFTNFQPIAFGLRKPRRYRKLIAGKVQHSRQQLTVLRQTRHAVRHVLHLIVSEQIDPVAVIHKRRQAQLLQPRQLFSDPKRANLRQRQSFGISFVDCPEPN